MSKPKLGYLYRYIHKIYIPINPKFSNFVELPGGIGGRLLDGEAGPGEDLAGGQVLDFDGNADDADEVHRIAELLLPLNLRRSRVRRRRRLVAADAAVVIVSAVVLHRALETAPCEAQSVGVRGEGEGGDFGVEGKPVPCRRSCCRGFLHRHCSLSAFTQNATRLSAVQV